MKGIFSLRKVIACQWNDQRHTKIYYRPRKVSRVGLVLIAVSAMAGLLLVENWPFAAEDTCREEKLAAAKLAASGMNLIKQRRQELGHVFNPHFDPAQTGMIGDSMTLVTSVPGNLRAKQTSVNPNFAAAVVQMLHDAGVEEGDRVAVGCSGSFPALNLAVYAALETLRAKPIIVASVAASQFGANMPDMLWIDMERLLHEEGLTSFRAGAASFGGYEDCGMGMCAAAKQKIVDGVRRNGLELIDEDELSNSIEQRMKFYQQAAGGQPVAAYINVGGGAASVGRTEGKKRYRPGLNLDPPEDAMEIDSVLTRFARTGVPVIHLVEISELAVSLGLPEAPQVRPLVGTGGIFDLRHRNRPLAVLMLIGIALALRLVVFTTAVDRLRQWLSGLRSWFRSRAAVPAFRFADRREELVEAGELMV